MEWLIIAIAIAFFYWFFKEMGNGKPISEWDNSELEKEYAEQIRLAEKSKSSGETEKHAAYVNNSQVLLSEINKRRNMGKINEDVNELIKFASSAEAKELTKEIEKENALRIQQAALFVIIQNIMLSNNVSEEKAKEIVFEQSLSIENKLREILQNPPQCLVHVSMQWHPHRP